MQLGKMVRFTLCRLRTSTLILVLAALAGCNMAVPEKAEINNRTKFSSEEFGVKASPRLTKARKVKKGGGRYHVGKPYKVRDKWYTPSEDPHYVATGKASWYGPNFHGRLTANGEIYDQYALSAAHPTMPLPSYARVTNLENGRSLIVRVNDRGPFAHNRVIDLSARAAELLNFRHKGVADVQVEYVGKARMDGKDERFLMASYRDSEDAMPGPQHQTLLAMSEEAIEDASELVALAVPVPMPRPGYVAGGIALDIARPATMTVAAVRPLGYLYEQPEAVSASANALAYIERKGEPTPDTGATVIGLGHYSSLEKANQVAADAAHHGLVAIMDLGTAGNAHSYEVRLLVGEDVAVGVFRALQSSGIGQAELQP